DKTKHRHFVRVTAARIAAALFPADVSLINLDSAAASAEWREITFAHRLADTVGKEPSRFVGDFENAMQLVGRDTILAARHEVDGLKHLMERDAGVLEHGAHFHGELTLAATAAPKADADALGRVSLDLREPLDTAAMRANCA